MARPIVGICVAAVLLVLGCESERIRGDRVEFLGQPVAASADVEGDQVTRVLITLPIEIVEGALGGGSGSVASAVSSLALPEKVRNETFAQFLQIASIPTGDPRALNAPQMALRYFGVPAETVNAVTCGAQTEVPPNRLPPGYTLPPQNQGTCIPGQAWRASAGTPSSGRGVVVGYDQGRLMLVEVQLSRDLLLEREPFIMSIPRPEQLGAAARYPTQFVGNYRSDLDAWEFAIDAFEQLDQ